MVFSLIGISIMTIIFYLLEILYYDFSFKTKDSLAHAPSSDYKLSLLFRFITVTLHVFIFFEYNAVYMLFNGLFAFMLLNNVISKMSYFEERVSKVYGVSLAILVWMNMSLLFVDLVNLKMLEDNIIVFTAVGTLFFLVLFLNIRAILLKSFITKDSLEISKDVYLDAKVRLFFKLAKDSLNESSSELLLASVMKIHVDKCGDMNCPCKERSRLFDPKKTVYGDNSIMHHKDFTFIKHYILYMIRSGAIRFLNSEILHLDMFYFLFDALRNYPNAFLQIYQFKKKISSDQNNMQRDFLIYRLMLRMDNYMKKRDQNGVSHQLSVEAVTRYDQELSWLKKKISDVCDNYIEIWEIIDSEYPDLNILYRDLKKNLNATHVVEAAYKRTVLLNRNSQELRGMMNVYAEKIIFDEMLASQVASDIKEKAEMEVGDSEKIDYQRLIQDWDMFDKKCCTLEMSTSIEKLGQIIGASERAPHLLKYEKNDLLNRNVNTLMPHVIGQEHDNILRNFFNNGRDLGLRSPLHIFGLNGKGYAFSMNLLIKVVPQVDSYRIIALINILNRNDYIITNQRGEIDAMGKNISEALGIMPDVLRRYHYKLNIQMLAPQTIRYFLHYYSSNDTNQQELIQDESDSGFRMYIPPNLDHFMQRHIRALKETGEKVENYKENDGFGYKKQMRDERLKQYNEKLVYMKSLLRTLKVSYPNKSSKSVSVKANYHFVHVYDDKIQLNVFKIIHKSDREISEKRKSKEDDRVRESIRILDSAIAKMRNKDILDEEQEDEENLEADGGRSSEESDSGLVQQDDKNEPRPLGELGKNFRKVVNLQVRKPMNSKILKRQRSSRESPDDYDKLMKPNSSFVNAVDTIRKNGNRVRTEGKKKSLEKRKSKVTSIQLDDEKEVSRKKAVSKNDIGQSSTKKMGGLFGLVAFLKSKNKRIEIDQEKDNVIRQRSPLTREDILKVFTERMKDSLIEKAKQARENVKRSKEMALYPSHVSSEEEHSEASKSDIFSSEGRRSGNSVTSGSSGSTRRVKINKNADIKQRILMGVFNVAKQKKEKHMEVQSIGSNSTTYYNTITRYLRDSLGAQRTPKVVKSTNYVIWALVLTLILITCLLHFVVIGQIGTAVSLISTYHLPSRYGSDLLSIFDTYKTLRLLANSDIDSTLYDGTWVNNSKIIREGIYTDIQQSLFEIVKEKEPETKAFLYKIRDYNLKLNQDLISLPLNFERFLKMVNNAVNSTLNYNLSRHEELRDEQLYLLVKNRNQVINLLDTFHASRMDLIQNELSGANATTRNEFIVTLIFLISGFSIVFPIIVRARMRFQDILVLFTKISKRDSDFYFQHYKDIRHKWEGLNFEENNKNNIPDPEEARYNSRVSSISRSRVYKNLENRYGGTICGGILSLIVFTFMISSRDIVYWQVVSTLEDFSGVYKDLAVYDYKALRLFLTYKDMLSFATEEGRLFDNNVTAVEGYLKDFIGMADFNVELDNVNKIETVESTKAYQQEYTLGNLCGMKVDSSQEIIDCGGLLKGVLNKGLSGYIRYFYNDIKNNYDSLLLKQGATQIDLAKKYLSHPNLKEFSYAWLYIKPVHEEWIDRIVKDLNDFKDRYSSQMLVLMVSTLVVILVWFWVIWRTQFAKLKKRVKYTNTFFTLLPSSLLKENQHIRTYLKKKLKVKALG